MEGEVVEGLVLELGVIDEDVPGSQEANEKERAAAETQKTKKADGEDGQDTEDGSQGETQE